MSKVECVCVYQVWLRGMRACESTLQDIQIYTFILRYCAVAAQPKVYKDLQQMEKLPCLSPVMCLWLYGCRNSQ